MRMASLQTSVSPSLFFFHRENELSLCPARRAKGLDLETRTKFMAKQVQTRATLLLSVRAYNAFCPFKST